MNSFGDWQMVRILGSGSFGQVILWRHRGTGQELATKRLLENNELAEDEISRLKMRWRQEKQWMRELQTDYIVRGVEMQDTAFMKYLNENHAWRPLEVITMEFCNGGDLRTHLQKIENLNGLQEFEVREIMSSLLHAINYMHEKCHIEHRDLKPDNIVVHQIEKRKIYKLTDFGFARANTDFTVQKSMVGTRNYFAPEVVHPAKYTKTVDYWSAGIIAFELMCGCLPFIPHQDLYEIIRTIRAKPSGVVAITEDISRPKQYKFHESVFPEHQCSSIFADMMSAWLRAALDIDYKSRGRRKVDNDAGQLTFFKDYENIYATKILRIFCPTTLKFYFYLITPSTALKELLLFLVNETGISLHEICFVFPLGHPRQQINVSNAYSLYVEEWEDTTEKTNPLAMLFVIAVEKEFQVPQPEISSIIKSCLGLDTPEKVPKWAIGGLEQQVHFLLAKENKVYHTFISAYHNYALKIDQEVVNFHAPLADLQSRMEKLNGQADHFWKMLKSAEGAYERKLINGGHTRFFTPWLLEAQNLHAELSTISTEVVQALQQRFSSAKRRIKVEANSRFLEEAARRDVFELAEFRYYLEHKESCCTTKDRFLRCKKAVFNCIEQREKVYASQTLHNIIFNITAVHKEWRKMEELRRSTHALIEKLGSRIETSTNEFFVQLSCMNSQQPSLNDSLLSDGSMRSYCSETTVLLNHTNETLRLLENFDFDEDMRDIPMTLSDINFT